MLHPSRLLLPFAAAALLVSGPAPAEARRSAQSLPSPARFSAKVRFATPAIKTAKAGKFGKMGKVGKVGAGKLTRFTAISGRAQREDVSQRGRGERGQRGGHEGQARHGRYDERHYGSDRDRHEYEKGKDHAGHHFGHHDHDDSPGC